VVIVGTELGRKWLFVTGVCLYGLGAQPASASAVFVAEYAFNNAGNLGLDSSGNGNNATVTGGETQGTGPDGLSAAVFNYTGGINDLSNLVYGGSSTFNPANGFTYSMWVNIANYGNFEALISQDSGGCCSTGRWVARGACCWMSVGTMTPLLPIL
jgi:hypothetical protein